MKFFSFEIFSLDILPFGQVGSNQKESQRPLSPMFFNIEASQKAWKRVKKDFGILIKNSRIKISQKASN